MIKTMRWTAGVDGTEYSTATATLLASDVPEAGTRDRERHLYRAPDGTYFMVETEDRRTEFRLMGYDGALVAYLGLKFRFVEEDSAFTDEEE